MTHQTIKWHQNCQVNVKHYIDKRRLEFQELKDKLKSDEEKYDFKETQICEAIRKGKEMFDDEKFMIKKEKINSLNYKIK